MNVTKTPNVITIECLTNFDSARDRQLKDVVPIHFIGSVVVDIVNLDVITISLLSFLSDISVDRQIKVLHGLNMVKVIEALPLLEYSPNIKLVPFGREELSSYD